MGWVLLFLLLPGSLGGPGPPVWEWGRVQGEGWRPDRTAKSLAFLGPKQEVTGQVEDNSVDSDSKKAKPKPKKAKLNVSDKDSPYALIDKYFPERESYFYQNKDKFVEEYRGQETKTDIGNISPSEVWLADDNLLVLKGGGTADRSGWDDPWQPLDDFQAPYREPVLPPPDFDPDSLEIGVGVDIETLLAERALAKEREAARELQRMRDQLPRLDKVPDIPPFVDPDNALRPFKDEVIQTHQKEFKSFFNDVSQFISDMENFHSARKASPRQEVDEPFFKETPVEPPPNFFKEAPVVPSPNFFKEVPTAPPPTPAPRETPPPTPAPPPPTPPPAREPKASVPRQHTPPFTSFARSIQPAVAVPKENFPAPTILREVHHSSSIEVLPKSFRETPPPPTTTTPRADPAEVITPAWQRQPTTTVVPNRPVKTPTSTPMTTTPYPLSYSSPHSKVYLSTKYVTHAPAPIPPPPSPPTRTQQSRTPQRQPTTSGTDQSRRPPAPRPSPPARPASSPLPSPAPVRIFRPRGPTPAPARAPSSPRGRGGRQEDWRPVTPGPRGTRPGNFNPAPTPYSLFQSVPENIGEGDVFHLSQNVDFGKKIGSGPRRAPLSNEVDTGYRRLATVPFSPAKPTHPPVPRPRPNAAKARQPSSSRGGVSGFRPSFGGPARGPPHSPPAKQKAPTSGARGRSSLARRRRPKAVAPRQTVDRAGDRSGTGDVRYVSFYSGGTGGNSWGYSYNLG